MLKSIHFFTAILLLLVISYTTGYKSWIRLSYEINKLEIIEKFCINKEEKSFQCDGKCHLKTQLEKADTSKAQNNATIVEENTLLLFHFLFKPLSIKVFRTNNNLVNQLAKEYYYIYFPTIFHPPK